MMGSGLDRPFIEEEFVDRVDLLGSLLKVARHETPKRILIVVGPFGIGKSWLMHRLESERAQQALLPAHIDFGVPPLGRVEWGYLEIVESARDQLGEAHFGAMSEIIETARRESEGLGIADPFATQHGAMASAAGAPPVGVQQEVGSIEEGGKAVGVEFGQVKGDVNYFVTNQVAQRSDQVVQQHYQAQITEAFRDGLAALTAERKVTFIFDSWLKATTPTRDWLFRTVVSWIRDKELEGAAAVLSDDAGVPELQGRHPRVHTLQMEGLSEEAVAEYWVERRGLDPEKATWVAQACLGHPLTLAMIADQHEMAGGL